MKISARGTGEVIATIATYARGLFFWFKDGVRDSDYSGWPNSK